jgi:hypothetical protein
MHYHVWLFLFSMLFSLPSYSTPAAAEPTKADTRSQPGDHHDKSSKAHAADGHAVSCAGQTGKASRVTRTIRMQALDTMRYTPEKTEKPTAELVSARRKTTT